MVMMAAIFALWVCNGEREREVLECNCCSCVSCVSCVSCLCTPMACYIRSERARRQLQQVYLCACCRLLIGAARTALSLVDVIRQEGRGAGGGEQGACDAGHSVVHLVGTSLGVSLQYSTGCTHHDALP